MTEYKEAKIHAKATSELPPESRDWKRAFVFNPAKVPHAVETKLPEKLRIFESDVTIKVKE